MSEIDEPPGAEARNRGPEPRLSAIVPFLNEAQNLLRYPEELYPALAALTPRFEVVLVDDGSRDASPAAARRLVAEQPATRLVSHEHNRGLGAALRSGIAASRGELLLTLDADLTFHPRLAGALLERFERGDVDVVSGSPDLAGYEDVPRLRIALSRGANWLYQAALGRKLSAVTPIFRLYRAGLVRALSLESERFEINAEILAKLLLAGARVAEVPARLTTRRHGSSKLNNLREIRNHLRLLRKIVSWRLAAGSRRAPRG